MNTDFSDLKSKLLELLEIAERAISRFYEKGSPEQTRLKHDCKEVIAFIEEVDVEAHFECAYCMEVKPYPPAEAHVKFDLDGSHNEGPVCADCAKLLQDYLETNAIEA